MTITGVYLPCDFCAGPQPRWRYPAHANGAIADTAGTHEGDVAWTACTTCHRLIEAGGWEEIVQHAIDVGAALPSDVPALLQAVVLREVFKAFRASRDGDPEELTPEWRAVLLVKCIRRAIAVNGR